MRNLTISYCLVTSLKKSARNVRTHSKSQIKALADCIREFGWTAPILVDEEGVIIAGHARVEAAQMLGMAEVPTLLIGDLTPAQKRAYMLADNKLAERAGWDHKGLILEFKALQELNFDLNLTGFETPQIDLLVGDQADASANDNLDKFEQVCDAQPTTQIDDHWVLGDRHHVICADARRPQTFSGLMGEAKAHMVFADAPYNVKILGHVSGLGKVKHGDFAMACGEMSEVQFMAFLRDTLGNAVAHSVDGSLHYVCMDWAHLYEVLAVGKQIYTSLKNICVWNKTNGGMGSLYRSKHELIVVSKHGRKPHINNIELGAHGRYRTNVWDYAGVNTFKAERQAELESHPTVKPVAMVADAIRDCTKHKQIVLDPFLGSGTTLIAAEITGRTAYGVELDPKYVDVAIRRWIDLTGGEVKHAITGALYPTGKSGAGGAHG